MASWMIHLRIADKLLDQIPNLSPIEFIMGNMAPDSGVPSADGSQFYPSVRISHFRTDDGIGKKEIDLDAFLNQYFSPELCSSYDGRQYAFFLGYYVHLLTDCLWSDAVAFPSMIKHSETGNWPNEVKKDWYDLDFLYLKKHPGFRAFRAYLGAVGFKNTFMDIFSEDAFDKRRKCITSFYLQERSGTDREYLYLTEKDADCFVSESVVIILDILKKDHR